MGKTEWKTLSQRVAKLNHQLTQRQIVTLERLSNYRLHHHGLSQFYTPSRTGVRFHASDAMVKAVMGPVGSGKSTMMCAEILLQACAMPTCRDGVRRSRWLVIRNTYSQLQTTTVETWKHWASKLGDCKLTYGSPIRFEARFNDQTGPIELVVEFLSIDTETRIAKLDSYEITGAWLNEARHLPELALTTLQDRAGRYPARAMLTAPFKKCLLLDTNPCDTDHWFFKRFAEASYDEHAFFKQPPGLIERNGQFVQNDQADNIDNLPDDYYTSSAVGKTYEHIKVMLMGEFGAFAEGDPVYSMYNDDLHCVDELSFLDDVPVIIGMDFGLTPAAVFSQLTPLGELRIIKEFVTDNMDLEQLLDDELLPYIHTQVPDVPITIVGDPSGWKRSEANSITCGDVLEDKGFLAPNVAHRWQCVACETNALDIRIGAVKWFLNRMASGRPAFQLAKANAMLRRGFIYGYQFQKQGDQSKPMKNEYSHVHDAIQYLCIYYKQGHHDKQVTETLNYKQDVIDHSAFNAI